MAKEPVEVLRKQAQEAMSRGHYQEARQLYQQLLVHSADNPDVHYGLATAFFLLGDSESAAYHFKQVIRLDPLRAAAYINLGAVQNRLEQYDEALATLRKAIHLDPNRAEGYYNMGLVYKQLGQLDMAINAYREAIRLNPRMYDAHYNLGNIFLEKEQFHQAIAHYKQALEIRPNWEKGKAALEGAMAHQQAVKEGSGVKPAPPPASTPESKLDPERTLDANFHGALLRELHDTTVETDAETQEMLEFLQKEVEEAIRELSICILTPKDPKYNLDDSIARFDEVVVKLQQFQESMQKRMLRSKLMGEQIARI
ncbi:MAG: tetratricopeptide repeat protein [Planctomycetes bacterium]|nr:tetratricopeptide repeat protein [Planctomycetota bacterium]